MLPSTSTISGRFYHVFVLFIFVLSVQVLASRSYIDQQKPPPHGEEPWYEKGWKRTTAANNVQSLPAVGGGGVKSPTRIANVDAGSGAGGRIGDLDESATAIGEDDEDANVAGSGDGSSSRVDPGSGDISLPTSTDSAKVVTVRSSPLPTPATTSAAIFKVEEATTTKASIPRPTVLIATRGTPAAPKVISTVSTTTTPRRTSRPQVVTSTTPRPLSSTPKKEKPTVSEDPHKPTPANFWMLPGVLAGLIGGAIVGLLAAILLVMFVVYRMRKKDEGSYALEEPKSPPNYAYAYQKAPTREFYA